VNSTGSAPAATSGVARSRPRRPSFAKIVERAGGGVQQVVNRFATWLDTDNSSADDEEFEP
jgi:hypothetical protein